VISERHGTILKKVGLRDVEKLSARDRVLKIGQISARIWRADNEQISSRS
jgi:hypothetical protein